jgi:hypothetical protein
MSACRTVGTTMVAQGCASQPSVTSKISSGVNGLPNSDALVVNRATASKTCHAKPTATVSDGLCRAYTRRPRLTLRGLEADAADGTAWSTPRRGSRLTAAAPRSAEIRLNGIHRTVYSILEDEWR